MSGAITETNAGEPIHGEGMGFNFRHMPDLHQAEHDIAKGGEMGEKIETLKHHAGHGTLAGEFPFAQAMPAAIPCHVTNRHIIKDDFATVKILKQIDATQKRGLAGTAGADDGDHFALVHLEIDTLQDLIGAEALGHAAYGKKGHAVLTEARSAGRQICRSVRSWN
jgi:hypothetical protein